MNDSRHTRGDKEIIIEQIADLSRLLGMIPDNGNLMITDPVTHNSVQLSEWFSDTRDSFLRLSVLIDKSMGLNLQ